MPTDNAQVASSPQSVPPSGAQSQVNGAGDQHLATTPNNAATTTHDGSGAQSQVNGATTSQDAATASHLTLEQALRELDRVRRENAETRTKLRTFETAAEEAQRAQMTREERLAADLATSEKMRADESVKRQELAMRYEVQLHATRLNIVDPTDAMKLIDASQIEYDDDGAPKNIGQVLQALVAAKPYLANAANTASGAQSVNRPAPTNASPTNPASTGNGRAANTFTESQIAAMSPDEYKRNRAAINQAVREGRIRQS